MKIAVVAQGAMGAGVGGALARAGVDVVTSLAGRSAASLSRARDNNMRAQNDAELASADMILSIVPPGDAMAFAVRMAEPLRAVAVKPLFVDCNAVSPKTAQDIAAIIAATGAPFADAGIVGGPPREGYTPVIYASGEGAARLSALCHFGLDIRLLEGPVGAASALKMSYAGITKGGTAIGAAMFLAATRAGAAHGLRDELAESQKALTPWLERQIPGMYAKAYRWVAEMREIAAFCVSDPAASAMYEAIAQFYEQMAAEENGEKKAVRALDSFLAMTPRTPKQTRVTYKDLLAAADKEVTTLSVAEALALRAADKITLVDLRDPRELEREGKIPGALHCPRGMLEFWIDPESPYFKPVFGEDRRFAFFCAAGWRSALAAQTAQRMGLKNVAHVDGGYQAWKQAGGPTELTKETR